MQKRINLSSVELRSLNIQSVIKNFCFGSGIVFITEGGKLIGGMTEGDIRRSYKNGQYVIDEKMINRNISFIVESSDMSKVFAEAEKIFKKNYKILNIPVVDKNMVLLYQIDREDNILLENIRKQLTVIRIHKSIAAFLECHQVERLVLTGSGLSILNIAKDFMEQELDECSLNGKVTISVIEDMDECKNLSGNVAIICLLDIAIIYLRNIIAFNIPILSVSEMRQFCFYKRLNEIHIEVFLNFLELFEYRGLCFYTSNTYLQKLISELKEQNVYIEERIPSDTDLFETELLAFSKSGNKEERIPLDRFYQTIQGIQEYSYITNKPLVQKEYIHDVLINAAYSLLRSYCNHVYIHRISDDKYKLREHIHTNRVIENFIKNEPYFSSKFLATMYGDSKFSIEQLWSDTVDCSIVQINEGYKKYQSNYSSKYFNTDTYGRRITTDIPQEYYGTVWLLGDCIYAGYAVADCDTIASILQRRLNELGRKYRVVNLGVAGTNFWSSIDAVSESEIGKHDIMVCWVDSPWNKEENNNVIVTDFYEFLEHIDEDEYWDSPWHCGARGYSIIAEQILEKIEPDLFQMPERGFHLDSGLEKEIRNFLCNSINEAKKKIDIFAGNSMKSGATVMNCNPFTYGHLYLVETASRLVDVLYVFVVEENKSFFPYEERFYMVQEGVKHINNVVVLPSGKFMISSLTFSGYFMKEKPDRECFDSFLDLKIFAYYIAPAFGITVRFVGEEPFDAVTASYNRDMKIILRENNIDVLEIPRKRLLGEEVISATKVRSFMQKEEYEVLKEYVPKSTMKCLEDRYRNNNDIRRRKRDGK